MPRFDKYDPINGGFRARLAANWLTGDVGVLIAVGIDANGRALKGVGNTGFKGVVALGKARQAGDPIDVMTSGEIVDCTGLVAGPESSSVTPVPASRDSAYVRAKRALQGENFTMDVVDSTGGRLVGTRWPSSSAQQGSSAACHLKVAVQIQGDATRSNVASTSRWISPGGMSDKAPKVCEQERTQVLERTVAVIVPPNP